MKIAVYEAREDELYDLRDISEELKLNCVVTEEIPTIDNLKTADGCEGISVLGQGSLNREYLKQAAQHGIRYISTRTIGYNHIDLEAAKEFGIHVSNVSYDPNGVADFTVMMMLMCIRHYKQAMWRGYVNDFELHGLKGREMKDLTVGIIGTGRIGAQVAKNLRGFGCRIIAHGNRQNPALSEFVTYVSLDELYAESDIITLHVPLNSSNLHMIDQDSIAKMKDGVILINCARGELCDIEALTTGIESQKIGALGLDTVEGESHIIHADHRTDILKNRNLFYLHQFRNVIMTQHMAFYTDAAVRSMVEKSMTGLLEMKEKNTTANMLV